MTKKRIRLWYSILLSVSLIVSGVCLMAACVGIYRSGERPFSPEAVAAAFAVIDIPVYASIVLILGSIVLELFMPVENKKLKPEKQEAAALQRMLNGLEMQYCAPHLREGIEKQERIRRQLGSICLALTGVCSIGFLVYALNIRNFPLENINAAMIRAMGFFIPCLLLPFGFGIFTAYYCRRSVRRELELVKQARRDGCPTRQKAEPSPAPKSFMPFIKAAIVVIAAGCLLLGLFNGGTRDVLTKAVNICTECVGLG